MDDWKLTMRQGSRDEMDIDALVHQLNQRYRLEFDRAEALLAELNDIKHSHWWPHFVRLRRFSQWCRKLLRRSAVPVINSSSCLDTDTITVSQPFHPRAAHPWTERDVSIVIPFRDQWELLERCVIPLHRTVPQAELVLVDNGSIETRTKNFMHRCRLNHHAQVVHLDEPFNFAKLCNVGAAVCKRDLLLFLNNDVLAVQPAWLDAMLEVIRDDRVGIVGATLLYPDRTIQHAGLSPTGPGGAWVHPYRNESESHPGIDQELRRIRTVPAVTGACLLIRRDIFEAVGGFDNRYPVTLNDVDLCQRVIQHGKSVTITPFARLWHFESLSRGYTREAA